MNNIEIILSNKPYKRFILSVNAIFAIEKVTSVLMFITIENSVTFPFMILMHELRLKA